MPATLKTRRSKRQGLRTKAINEYHELLAADTALSPIIFDKLRSAMRTNRLVYGDRPLGVALRPHFLDDHQFEALVRSAQLVASAMEKVAAIALESPQLLTELGLTDTEAKLALVNPGFSFAGVTTRLDAFVHEDEIRFVEYNAENPSSLSDQEGLNQLLFEIPAMTRFAERYRFRQFSAVERLLETLLTTYHEWSGRNETPNIAILDWENLPTSNEFVLLRNHFATHGVRTIICSPDDLEYRGQKLCCGNFPINLVYKRILIHEFLNRFDETHPLIRAYVNRHVCLVNPFRCKIMHKKAGFELLTDEKHAKWFSRSENETINRCVPWTRRVKERQTTHFGRSIDLIPFIRANREHLVLKPNDDYGGHGVYFGPELDSAAWENAIASAIAGDYVAQEAVELRPEHFPVFGETQWTLQPMFVDTNPFLFRGTVCGAMVRLSGSPVVNVTSGGGETGFFVISNEP